MDPDGSSYTHHLLSSAFCQALYYVFLPFVIGAIAGEALNPLSFIDKFTKIYQEKKPQ